MQSTFRVSITRQFLKSVQVALSGQSHIKILKCLYYSFGGIDYTLILGKLILKKEKFPIANFVSIMPCYQVSILYVDYMEIF